MASVMSRSLGAPSVAVISFSPSLAVAGSGVCAPRSVAALPSRCLAGKGLSAAGLRWKLERRGSGVVVRCDAAVAERDAAEEAPGEKFEYQAEVSRLMDLIVHSLYSHKEVFLRELAACKNDPSSTDARRAVDLLYDTALISSGFTPDSPAELGSKIYQMMAIALGGRWGRSDDAEGESSEGDSQISPEDGATEAEAQVVDPSEVRTENDPWKD